MEKVKTLISLSPLALFHLSWISSLYFLFLALDTYYIKSSFVLIGVVREIITLPLMAAQLAICAWAFFWNIKEGVRIKGYMLWLLIVSILNSMAILSMFF